jgi:hypothetical protein
VRQLSKAEETALHLSAVDIKGALVYTWESRKTFQEFQEEL